MNTKQVGIMTLFVITAHFIPPKLPKQLYKQSVTALGSADFKDKLPSHCTFGEGLPVAF